MNLPRSIVLWQLQMPLRRREAVASVFLVGVVVNVALPRHRGSTLPLCPKSDARQLGPVRARLLELLRAWSWPGKMRLQWDG